MSGWLFGQSATQQPKYSSLTIQTASQSQPIQIAWGQVDITPNLIWYNDFTSTTTSSGGKGGATGGKGGGSQTTYSVAVIMALCEGPVQSVVTVYEGSGTKAPGTTSWVLYDGTLGQAPVPYITTHHPTQADGYSQTAYLFNPTKSLGSSPNLPSLRFEMKCNLSGTVPGHVDANPADIIVDLLTNPQYKVSNLTTANFDSGSLATYKTYCQAQGLLFSPSLTGQDKVVDLINRWAQLSNSWIFWSGNVMKFYPLGDQPVTGNGATYTPVNPVRYNLGVDDFVGDNTGVLVTVTRKDPADCYNRTALTIKDRSNSYNNSVVEYKDQTLIDQVGLRDAGSISAPDICDRGIGQTAADLLGKNYAFVRNTYTFKTTYRYILLEPGDIVTLTEPNIPLNATPVRIVSVGEDKSGNLSFTAEEFTGVVGQPAGSVPQPSTPDQFNTGADPGNVNPPCVFEPNSALTGKAQLWIAASGGPNWGSADVYISFDGTAYGKIGEIRAPAKQGSLTANLAAHADPDTTNTLSVDLTESAGVLNPVTHADADALRSLAVINPQPASNVLQTSGLEILSYGNVSATGTYTANLTYLRRGQYGTSGSSHASGDMFTLVDITGATGSTLVYDLPAAYIGQTIYLKFVSNNTVQGASQDISSVVAYQYTPTGRGYGGGAGGVPSAPTGLTVTSGVNSASLNWAANATTDNVTGYQVWRAPGSGAPFSSAAKITTTAGLSYTDPALSTATAYTYFLVAVNAAGSSANSGGVSVVTGTASSNAWILQGSLAPGSIAAAFELFNVSTLSGMSLAPASVSQWIIECEVAPTATATLTLSKNGSTIGTATIAAGATTGSWSFSSPVTFSAGDSFKFTAPATADATLSGLSYTIVGSR